MAFRGAVAPYAQPSNHGDTRFNAVVGLPIEPSGNVNAYPYDASGPSTTLSQRDVRALQTLRQ